MVTAKTKDEIDRELNAGRTPLVNSVELLLKCGFERAYPQIKSGYHASVWIRVTSHYTNTQSNFGSWQMVKQIAILESSALRKGKSK